MTDRWRLQEWLDLLDDKYLPCLVEVAAVLVADQYGILHLSSFEDEQA